MMASPSHRPRWAEQGARPGALLTTCSPHEGTCSPTLGFCSDGPALDPACDREPPCSLGWGWQASPPHRGLGRAGSVFFFLSFFIL